MSFSDLKYEIKIRNQLALDGYSDDAYIEDGVLAFIYTAGTKTLATLYSDANRTSLANPITRTQFAADDGLVFYTGEATVDIFLSDGAGNTAIYTGISNKVHTLTMDTTSVSKHFVIPFDSSNTTETDTGVDLPVGFEVKKMMLEVVTNDTDETLDVGLLSTESNGDANGLLVQTSLGSTGYIEPITVTTGSNEVYISGTTYGALHDRIPVAGSDVSMDVGTPILYGHKITVGNAQSVVYNGSAGSDTGAGYIHIYGDLIR